MRIGEIIETTSVAFVAESLELNRPPPLGSLVTVRVPEGSSCIDVYAVVTHGQTLGLDPSRRALRRSTDTVFDGAVYDENPELLHVLRTEFSAALVGFYAEGHIRQHLPPQPPPLHFSVLSTSAEDVLRFTGSLHYFRQLLTASAPVPPQQVLAANIREVFRERGNDHAWLRAAAREIAALLRDDHEALLTILYTIDPGVQQ
jgi:hypothetical protein